MQYVRVAVLLQIRSQVTRAPFYFIKNNSIPQSVNLDWHMPISFTLRVNLNLINLPNYLCLKTGAFDYRNVTADIR